MKELTVVDTNILKYKGARVMAVKAGDGRIYISRADTAKAIEIGTAAMISYSINHCKPDEQRLIPITYQTSANKQEVPTSFIEYNALLVLLTKRLSITRHPENVAKAKRYLDWLKTQDLFNDNRIDELVKKHNEPTSTPKETAILSVVIFDKCVLRVTVNR